MHGTPKVGCFFKTVKLQLFLLLYYSASKKATAMVFIWGDRGYPAVRFEYKTAFERYFQKNIISEFLWKHPKLLCLYLSNQISLRDRFVFKTNGRIFSITSYKDHCCSFFTSWVIKQQKSCILKVLKKHPTSGVRCAPKIKFFGPNIFGVKFPT